MMAGGVVEDMPVDGGHEEGHQKKDIDRKVSVPTIDLYSGANYLEFLSVCF